MEESKRTRVLVAWGGKLGGTEGIARIVGEALTHAGFHVDVKQAAEVRDVSLYDAAIVGGALYANRWHRDAHRLVARNAAALRRMPVWLFSSGPLDDSADQRDIAPTTRVAALMDRIGALGHATFGGRLARDAKGFLAAAMAKNLSGDWRNPDRIRAWTAEVARALPTARPGRAKPEKENGEQPARRLVIALAAFSALSAIGGATELLIWRTGNRYVPLELLEHTPFTTFLIPGLLLGIVVGGTSLACMILVWRRSHVAVDATILAGGALTVWILAEVAMMRGFHLLHGIFGVLGAAILALGTLAAWRSNAPRHRWLILVTFAEAIGFLVPACTGVLSSKAGMADVSAAALVAAAGFLEGLALGVGQAWAFPLPIRRTRYALLTALGAGIVWSSVMLVTSMIGSETVPVAVQVLAGVVTALVGLAAIGLVQWIELRHHAPDAHRWIVWTALAWATALPLSFLPAPFVDESTPIASQVVLWGCGGLLMAYVMTLITWKGVRSRCDPPGSS